MKTDKFEKILSMCYKIMSAIMIINGFCTNDDLQLYTGMIISATMFE